MISGLAKSLNVPLNASNYVSISVALTVYAVFVSIAVLAFILNKNFRRSVAKIVAIILFIILYLTILTLPVFGPIGEVFPYLFFSILSIVSLHIILSYQLLRHAWLYIKGSA